MELTEQQKHDHERLFKEAAALIEKEIPLHERRDLPKPGWLLRRKLKRAIALFQRVLEINPGNWSAMWLIGKVYQRFNDYAVALTWFDRAYQINASQPDVAREASMCAMDIGQNEAAIAYAFRGTQIEPGSAGLHANLALAYLLAGRLDEARASVERSLTIDPGDRISQTVKLTIVHFAGNGRTPPSTAPALIAYWQKNRKG